MSNLVSVYSVLDQIDMAVRFLDDPYKAPEQIEWARNYLAAINADFGVSGHDILNHQDPISYLENLLIIHERNIEDKYVSGRITRLESDNDVLPYGYTKPCQWLVPPAIGRGFDWKTAQGWGKTSRVEDIIVDDPKTLLIKTRNSIYKLEVD